MAEQNDKLDFSQPKNMLSEIADRERAKLFPRNDYSPVSESYSSTHPNAIADGDEDGRGTGNFLDIHNFNGGTITDINERIDVIKTNKYSSSNPYNLGD